MNKEWPGYPAVICQNLICVGAGVLCAIYYDRVSFPFTIIRNNSLDFRCLDCVRLLCWIARNYTVWSVPYLHMQPKSLPIFQIGDLIRYAGSLCAAIYMYLLPCLVKLIDEKKENGKISIISMIIHCIIILYGTANFVLQFAVEAY